MGLKVGDVIPNFKAKDANGNDFDSQNIVGKKPLVIYFYPKDNTLGVHHGQQLRSQRSGGALFLSKR